MNYEKLQKPNICKISHINTEKRHVTLCHTIFGEITSIYNNGLGRNVTWMMRNCKKKENSFSPRRRFLFQTEISSNYIVLVLISRFYFLSSLRRGDQSAVFCIVYILFMTGIKWMRPTVYRLSSTVYRLCFSTCLQKAHPYRQILRF